MRKLLLSLTAMSMLAFAPLTFAAVLDAETIKQVHDVVKSKVIDKCMTSMKTPDAQLCSCIGETAQKNLDDKVLATCDNSESGGPCITKAVSTATIAAMSDDSIKACVATDATKVASDTKTEAATTSIENSSNESEPETE